VCLAAASLVGTAARAQDRTAEIDRLFAFATADGPGCAVGVSQRGAVVARRAYGLADVDRRVPLGERSRFDIGSTQKQFVAAAVLRLVEDGRLALSDDVRKHLPELPDYGHRVTIDHLLTHTSGVRDWTGLLPMAPEGTEVLPLLLRQRGLNFAPGTQWAYSNGGFVLLKEIVARASGVSFADFARTRLFEPLGMRESAYVPDILQAGPDAARGYQKDARAAAGWTPFMRLGANRGGGTIASTVGDLLLWNAALATGKLGAFVTAKLQEPARLSTGRTLRYARGLMVDSTPGGTVVAHSGGAAGFSTWMGRVPEHGLAVVVACNFDPVSATALAGRVADLFLPPVDSAARRRGPAAAPGVDVTGRAGLYFDERTGEPLRLGVANGRLMIANGPPLVPVSAASFRPPRTDLFFRSQDDFTLAYRDADRLEITSMEGQTTRYRRARPWTPTAADLQGAAGRYGSAELGSVVELAPAAGGGLVLRLERAAGGAAADGPERTTELAPVERDTYMQRMMIVRLRRDPAGRVVGFDYGNPLVRNLAFARLGDRAADGRAAPPPVASAPANAAPAAGVAPAPAGLVGEYEVAPGRTIAISAEGGQLYGRPPGGAPRALTHVAGSTYAAAGSALTLTFTLGPDGRASALVMRQNGNERVVPRVR
jgi:CubicO group peptidase (beta-lactamase class C family)